MHESLSQEPIFVLQADKNSSKRQKTHKNKQKHYYFLNNLLKLSRII